MFGERTKKHGKQQLRFEEEWLREKALSLLPPRGLGGLERRTQIARSAMSFFLNSRRKGLSFWTGVRLATYLGIDLRELQQLVQWELCQEED